MTRRMLTTKEVAHFLGVNEKMVYSLISEKGLPATKITGKWVFPQDLVEQWIDNHTMNFPTSRNEDSQSRGLLIVAGSNDLLLDRTISLFNERYPDHLVAFANIGSMGGLQALRRNICRIASSHLLQDNEEEYNFAFAEAQFEKMPVVVNFCRREQGLLIRKEHLEEIRSVSDLGKPNIRIVNRSIQTGTRHLFDHELKKAGLNGERIDGYSRCVNRHLDVGLEILSGKADAGPAIRSVAALLGLGFIPLRWERYDLLISKDRFFDQDIQSFLGILHDADFQKIADDFEGYDIRMSGRILFPDASTA